MQPNHSRRTFLAGSGVALAAGVVRPWACRAGAAEDNARRILRSQPLPAPEVPLPTDQLLAPQGPPKRVAAITTSYFKYSHADDIITKFIEGYGVVGRVHEPHCRVVGMYVDQFPPTDIGRGMAARYRIPLYDSPADALRVGGDELGVDAVLLIGEHGDYPSNEKGQKLYPRRRLYEEIVKVFRQAGRGVPVFNDKHLSFSWSNAQWMYDQAQELGFPLMAGSSVPVTWRRPPLAFAPGVPLQTALVVGSGGFESYGFHCLEFLQTFVERRAGGETGVSAVQALAGDEAFRAAKQGRWPAHLLPAAIAPVPGSEVDDFKLEQLRGAVVFRVEYSDGFEAAVCMSGHSRSEFCFAGSVSGQQNPLATWAYLPKPQRDHFSFLCNHIELMFRSGKPSYPVERTLLVTGVLDALHDSRAAGGRRVVTPHLSSLSYAPAVEFGVSG